jgi:DNA-directed RNA polymerase specialized sigma24 family protein
MTHPAHHQSRPEAAADRWQLTEETFSALLAALDPSVPRAVERYQRLHGRLVFFFMRHRALSPEDLADICINRIARKLADGESIVSIEAFTLGIARMVLREDMVGSLRAERAFSEWMRNESQTPSTTEEEGQRIEAMERHLAALPPSSRQMLADYHQGSGQARIRRRQQLAHELGISINTLRKRVFDLHAQLRFRLARGLRAEPSVEPREESDYR